MLAFLPALIVVIVQYQLIPPVDLENRPDLDPGQFSIGGQLLSVPITSIGTSLITALIVRLAYDAKIGNPMRPMAYVSSTIAVIIPLAICSIVVSIASSIAMIVPGLWVYAVWCCVTPAIVIENDGYNSFDRSAQLTKDYRWPCLGALLIVGICSFFPLTAIDLLYAFDFGNTGFALGSVYIFFTMIGTIIYMAMFGICIALIYVRLREIKEGTRVEQLAEVFA